MVPLVPSGRPKTRQPAANRGIRPAAVQIVPGKQRRRNQMVPLVPSGGPKSRRFGGRTAPIGKSGRLRCKAWSFGGPRREAWRFGQMQCRNWESGRPAAQKRNTGTPDSRKSLHKYYSKPSSG
ncbi:MAG TPA: hypothetical protein DF480_03730 [Clostridiales bacterium]|nr:hypothetical protein [Clostridiales bacterium]